VAENLPVSFPCFVPKVGYHQVLVIAVERGVWTCVNYRGWRGPIVEKVPLREIALAPAHELEKKMYSVHPRR
jgi:hypothetical protein